MANNTFDEKTGSCIKENNPDEHSWEKRFADLYSFEGPAMDCVRWICKEYKLYPVGPHRYAPEKHQVDEEWEKEYYSIIIERVNKAKEAFDDKPIQPEGPIMHEIYENLNRCATHEERLRYANTLIQPFKSISEAFGTRNHTDGIEKNIKFRKECIKKLQGATPSTDEEGKRIAQQIEEHKQQIIGWQADIDYANFKKEKIFDLARRGAWGNFEEGENRSMLSCLGCWYQMYTIYATNLASVLLIFNIDLAQLQEECNIYLIEDIGLYSYVDHVHISTQEHAQVLINKAKAIAEMQPGAKPKEGKELCSQKQQKTIIDYFTNKGTAEIILAQMHSLMDHFINSKIHGHIKKAMLYIHAAMKYNILVGDVPVEIIKNEFNICRQSYGEYKYGGPKADYVEDSIYKAYRDIISVTM